MRKRRAAATEGMEGTRRRVRTNAVGAPLRVVPINFSVFVNARAVSRMPAARRFGLDCEGDGVLSQFMPFGIIPNGRPLIVRDAKKRRVPEWLRLSGFAMCVPDVGRRERHSAFRAPQTNDRRRAPRIARCRGAASFGILSCNKRICGNRQRGRRASCRRSRG